MIYNLSRLKQQLDVHNLDAIIAATRENIRYFTGFEPVTKTLNPYYGQCYVVVTRANPEQLSIVHTIAEVDQLLDITTPLDQVHCYGRFYRESLSLAELTQEEKQLQQWSIVDNAYESPEQALATLLKVLNLENSRIGYDENGFSPVAFSGLQSNLSKTRFIPVSELLRFVRRVKTAYEIEQLTLSACCNQTAIKQTVDNLYEGISEIEIARLFELSLIEQGARPSLTMLKIGRHAIGGQRPQREDIRLARGDLLWFDSDALYQGFWSDIARVYAYGYAPENSSERYAALAQGMNTATREISAGMRGDEVFNLTMKAVHQAGFGEYRRQHVGHGIGLEAYERPVLAPTEQACIEEGMVISVETPFYDFGFGALHIEDPVLINSEGNLILTQHKPKELLVIDA